MPRLIGKQSNTGSYAVFAFLLGLVIGSGVVAEYFGAINLVPTFGHQGRAVSEESTDPTS